MLTELAQTITTLQAYLFSMVYAPSKSEKCGTNQRGFLFWVLGVPIPSVMRLLLTTTTAIRKRQRTILSAHTLHQIIVERLSSTSLVWRETNDRLSDNQIHTLSQSIRVFTTQIDLKISIF